jgi:hypothetical protein
MNLGLIRVFLLDQRRAKQEVSKHFNVPPEMTAMDWVGQSSRFRTQFAQRPFADVFKPHGYGLELRIADFYIDFDYSTEGRSDGFDAWRLFVYITAGKYDNTGADGVLCGRVFEWFEELKSTGRIIHSDNLYYLAEAA